MTDPYELLGVTRESTPEEIKKAYRKLAREYHPDVNPDPEHQDRFKEITAAYEILSDPEKRARFEAGGDEAFAGFGGLGDIFEAFFGGGAARGGSRSRVRRGADQLVGLTLDLAETAFGSTKDVTVDTAVRCDTCGGEGTAAGTHPEQCGTCGGRGEVSQVQRSIFGQVMTARPCPRCQGAGSIVTNPCLSCHGDGRLQERRTLTVKIPAGVEDGMRIRLTGEGEAGAAGGPPGDLYVEVRERDHAVFERDGDNLHCKVSLPMTAAALGTTIPLQTLDSLEDINVKAGTQSGDVITLRARGIPHLRATGRGDLHVHVEVRTPTGLDDEQERLLRELAVARGEELVDGAPKSGGLFGRLRDVLGGR